MCIAAAATPGRSRRKAGIELIAYPEVWCFAQGSASVSRALRGCDILGSARLSFGKRLKSAGALLPDGTNNLNDHRELPQVPLATGSRIPEFE